MADLKLDLDENIIEQTENVERYQKNDKYTEIYEMYLTNQNLILVYEKSTGLLKTEDVTEKILLSDIKIKDGEVQIFNVDDNDYGKAMQVFFKDGSKDYFVFENKKDINIWIQSIKNVLLEKSNNDNEESSTPKEKKTLDKKQTTAMVVKCPNCGANIKSFESRCPYCKSEIRNIEASSNLKNFSLGLEKIVSKELPKYHEKDSLLKKVVGKDFRNDDEKREFERKAEENRQKAIASYIKNYPIPNSREDLLEFMILANSNIDMKKDIDDVVLNAWIDKMEQIYKKATITLSGSKDLNEIEDIYNKKMKKVKNKKIIQKALIPLPFVICILLLISIANIFWGISCLLIILSICLFIFYKLKKEDLKFLANNRITIYVICGLLLVASLILGIIGIKYNHEIHYNPDEENYYNESVEKNNVEIEIEFEENILFNRYDVELSVYDQKVTLLHGEDKTVNFKLPDGTHVLRFENMDEGTGDTIELKVRGNTKVSYKISCHTDEIKIREVSVQYLDEENDEEI